MNRLTTLLVLIGISVVSAVLLLSGSSLLIHPLLRDPFIPAGSVITWTGLITWAFCFRLILLERFSDNGRQREIRKLSLIFTLPALCWGLLSYGLAGNWHYTFTSMSAGFRGSVEAGKIFWYMTYLTIGAPAIISMIYFLALRKD